MLQKCLLPLCASLVATFVRAETWTMTAPHAWSREEGAAKMSVRADGALELRHLGSQEWSVHGVKAIDVRGGDVFRLSCSSEALDDVPSSCAYSIGAILTDGNGEVVNWTYGIREALPGKSVVSVFMVPPGTKRVEPRIVGRGRTGVVIRDFRVELLGNCLARPDRFPQPDVVETKCLLVTVFGAGAGLAVTDRRTGRTWSPDSVRRGGIVTEVSKAGSAIVLKMVCPETMRAYDVTVTPHPGLPEVLVTVTGLLDLTAAMSKSSGRSGVLADCEMTENLDYPPAFATRKGDRLIVPMNEGVSYPADDPDGIPVRLAAYSGHGVCMSFFGVQDDATGAGYMGLVETADDASVIFKRLKQSATVAPGVSWEPQKGGLGYARRIRYVFFEKGGYVAMCKRYRAYAKASGRIRTFAEKAKDRPLVDRLIGAPNVWTWERDKVGLAKELKAAGIDRFLWSGGGNAREVEELTRMEGVLVSRYDVYRDIYRPEQLKKLGWKNGTNTDAWPDGAAWDSADPSDWRKAWRVKAPDGTWTYCACLCDAVAAKYCRRHVSEQLKTIPYTCRFVDVTTAAPWDTCFNPAHPMTRSESRAHRMDLLRLLGDEYGLVVGSETGHDAAVPYCDYFEGMLSLCDYRVPDSGYNIGEIWTNVPPRVAKFQVGAAYRLPLWELVYHDCLCAHWYWGDFNNKLPSLWDKRDLFNVLYGTMGMYMFNRSQWKADKERFVRSYRTTSPVARKTGYSEMLDHRILTPDRLVQQSVFSDGTTVTVNFGDKTFAFPDGGELVAGGYRVELRKER